MLTEEQIKNLQKGDTVMFTSEVALITDNFAHIATPDDVYSEVRVAWEDLSLPPSPPKYDTNRRFKKGDLVKFRKEFWGRPMHRLRDDGDGYIWTLSEDERDGSLILQRGDFTVYGSFAQVELVTPVEERDLYFVLDSPATYNVCKRGESGFAATFFKKHPLAREKADEYCEALNEEIRKEVQS